MTGSATEMNGIIVRLRPRVPDSVKDSGRQCSRLFIATLTDCFSADNVDFLTGSMMERSDRFIDDAMCFDVLSTLVCVFAIVLVLLCNRWHCSRGG